MPARNLPDADEEPLLNGTEAQNSYPLKNLGNRSPHSSREEQDDYLFDSSHTGREAHTLTGQDYLKWPILKSLRPVIEWCIGPQPPRIYKIKPIYADAQTVLPNLLKRIRSSELRVILLLAVYGCWIAVVGVLLLASSPLCFDSGYGRPVRLSCTSRFCTLCGVNGDDCRPFHNHTIAFQCPASCRSVMISTPETIGGQEVNYRSVVVGGFKEGESAISSIYRGDSFICAAAIHAGIIYDRSGGSGRVSLVGEHNNFPSIEGNGILSIGFAPTFPLSFTFPSAETITSQCLDPRWNIVTVSILFTCLISLFTESPAVFFGSAFVGIYFTVALSSDPPDFQDYYSVISSAFGQFLPAASVMLVLYHLSIHRTLYQLTAQVEKTILWLGGCWVGALYNYTFDKIPVQRLTLHDIRQQPGAVAAVIIILILVICIALGQAWAFRIEGRMLRYLYFYILVGFSLIIMALIPNMNLRLHHYIFAIIFIPGTSLQTRPSLLYQGILVGMFIDGIARWGFDSILQTPDELFGRIGKDVNVFIPQLAAPIINGSKITFSWPDIVSAYDGISMLVNDVERFHSYEDHNPEEITWTRYKEEEEEYFRFAYVKYGHLGGTLVGDYSKPGVWTINGSWIPPLQT